MPLLTPPKDHPSTLPLTDQLTLIKKIRSVNKIDAPYETFRGRQINAKALNETLILADAFANPSH
jgi:hypothetical protein